MAEKTKVDYMLKADDKEVLIEADFYVPFEPKKSNIRIRDKVVELKNIIKLSVRELVVDNDEMLLASYSENDKKRLYDVENMLFFNIGTSSFSKCCEKQIAFVGDEERFFTPEKQHTDTEEKFFYSYRVVRVSQVENMLEDKRVIASWDGIPVDLNLPQSATRYYATIRENATNVVVCEALKGKELFGMKLEVTMPFKSLPASIMKPLLDGIVCAFHGEEEGTMETLELIFPNTKEVVNKFSERLNILGKRKYVSQYRGDSYKWNPEDERLQFAWITVRLGKEAKLSGKIYKWG